MSKMHFGHNLTNWSLNKYICFMKKKQKILKGLNHWLLLTFFSKLDYGIYIDGLYINDLNMRSNIAMTILKYWKLWDYYINDDSLCYAAVTNDPHVVLAHGNHRLNPLWAVWGLHSRSSLRDPNWWYFISRFISQL